MQNTIDLPNFLSASTSPCVDVADTRAYSTSARVSAANPAPGMALTQDSIDFELSSSSMISDSVSPAMASEKVGGVAGACSALSCGENRTRTEIDTSGDGVERHATDFEYCSKVPRSVSKPDGNRTPCVLSGPQPPWICRGERRPTRLGEQQTDLSEGVEMPSLKSAVGVTAGRDRQPIPADVIEIPEFLTSATRQTQHASDGNAFRTTGLAVTRGGVAEPREQRGETDKTDFPKHSEPRDHRARIEPERAGSVISINSENVERTA